MCAAWQVLAVKVRTRVIKEWRSSEHCYWKKRWSSERLATFRIGDENAISIVYMIIFENIRLWLFFELSYFLEQDSESIPFAFFKVF